MKKRIPYDLTAAAVILAILGVLCAAMVKQEYQDKMSILQVMISADKSGEDSFVTAAGILKGKEAVGLETARKQLEEHGYTDTYMNIYRERLNSRYVAIAAAGPILFALYAAFLFLAAAGEKRRNAEGWNAVQHAVNRIRDGADIPSALMEQSGVPDEESFGRLCMSLDSLASYVQTMKEKAETEKEETKSLVTDISHQLKTPVAALKTSFDILKHPALTREEQIEFFSRCELQMIRLEELVAALVNISRMETGMIRVRREEKNIFDTVLTSVNRIYPRAEEKQIDIGLEAAEEIRKLVISHDAGWLSEAIINVLENAVKYSPAGSLITIRMMRMNLFLRIEIEDEGIGIPREEWNRIFKRFYRGEHEAVRQEGGSGVGLYLARQILEHHQGTITVAVPSENRKKGSRFVLQLPYQ